MLFIVIPVLNRKVFTENCLNSLFRQVYSDYKIIVVDHGSDDGTDLMVERNFKEVILLRTDNSKWWTGSTNVGIKKAIEISTNEDDLILTLNNDLEVSENYLKELIKLHCTKKPAVIGSITVNFEDPNQILFCGTKWNSLFAKYTNLGFNKKLNQLSVNLDCFETDLLPGRGTLYPIEIFKKFGLFDEKNFPHYAADEDYSRMASINGYKLFVSTKAVIKSYYKESGLKEDKINMVKYFSSLKSPANLKRRWLWALKNSPIPLVYFICDFSRIFHSYLKYRLK